MITVEVEMQLQEKSERNNNHGKPQLEKVSHVKRRIVNNNKEDSAGTGLSMYAHHEDYLKQHKNQIMFHGTEITLEQALGSNLSLHEVRMVTSVIRRHQFFLETLKLDPSKPRDHLKMLQHCALKPTTWDTYSSHWRQILESGRPLTSQGFTEYMIANVQNINQPSIPSWFNAITHFIRVDKMEDEIQALGYMKKAFLQGKLADLARAVGPKPCGDLSNEDLEKMLEMKEVAPSTKAGMIVQQAFAERAGRVADIRHFQITPRKDLNGVLQYYVLRVLRKKVPVNSTVGSAYEEHQSNPQWNAYLTRLIKQAQERYERTPIEQRDVRGELLVPGWKGSGENKTVKEVAARLGLSKEMRWSTHASKYGGVCEAMKKAAELGMDASNAVKFVQQHSAHKTAAMTVKYGQPREEKVAGLPVSTKRFSVAWAKNIAARDPTTPLQDEQQRGMNYMIRNRVRQTRK
jgi:hypothetical protein